LCKNPEFHPDKQSILDFIIEKTSRIGAFSIKFSSFDSSLLKNILAGSESQNPIFLDSSLKDSPLCKWSIVALDPEFVISHKKDKWIINIGKFGSDKDLNVSAFELMNSFYSLVRSKKTSQGKIAEEPPFKGGFAGYLSYDFKFEKSNLDSQVPSEYPSARFGFYTSTYVYSHQTEELFIYSSDEASFEQMKKKISNIVSDPCTDEAPTNDFKISAPAPEIKKEKYLESVLKVKEHISRGDIYQANFSHKFSSEFKGSPLSLYFKLRESNPAPFSAFIQLHPSLAVLSSSPERLFSVKKNLIKSSPIKGTIARSPDPSRDKKNIQTLLNSEKDEAELNMIIDLVRNDIGRISQYGSVKVKKKKELQSYQRVHHLVGTINGKLHEDTLPSDVFSALFPGGSITGTPKIRSMEILSQLESKERGPYTGSIGYLDNEGNMDFNIAIRTILINGNKVAYQVGGGIVADSDPEAEYEETLDKARAMAEAFE